MGWRSRLASWLDPQAAREAREFRLMRRGESMEFTLQRRIHKQRKRLAQLEEMKGWHVRSGIRDRWMAIALRIGKENNELKARLAEIEPKRSDEEVAAEIRGWVESYGLHRNWVVDGQRCCSPDELDAAIAHEISERRERNSTSMIVTTGEAACAPGVFLPPAPQQ